MSDGSNGYSIPTGSHSYSLRARRLGIDTQYEAIVFMRADCPVCRSEGFTAQARIRLASGDRSIIATLYQVTSDLLTANEAGLSESAWRRLGLSDGGTVTLTHSHPLGSLDKVRRKIGGERLDAGEFGQIIGDIIAGRYTDIHLSSFITACSANSLDLAEMIALTRAMTEAGERLDWKTHPVVDKHCVGGLPGNRTTPIVVAIVAACGLTMPKTSSRAITSPSGTADTMETMAPVELDIPAMRRVVETEGGCIVWGGSVRLSPADDTLIRVERALEIDTEGQLVASVLSKKIAAGSTHLVLDLPVGPTAKVKDEVQASALSDSLLAVAKVFGVEARALVTDGRQPVGRGIGPALEAHDVLAVLENAPDAPQDLRERALTLAGALIELAGLKAAGSGRDLAKEVLADGRAWNKFQRICEAQGGMRIPPVAPYRHEIVARHAGLVESIDNHRLARVAKLAGAPDDKAAGLKLHVRLGDTVELGQPLFTVHAQSPGELAYSLDFISVCDGIVSLKEG